MAWTDGDLKVFAAGLAVGGEWNATGQTALPPPTADPPPGAYYGQVLYVKLLTATEGAIIRYSTDGTVPSALGPPFNEDAPIEVSETKTIRAFAQLCNQTSRIAELVYKVDNPFIVTDLVLLERSVIAVRDGGPTISTAFVQTAARDRVALSEHLLGITDASAEVEIVTN